MLYIALPRYSFPIYVMYIYRLIWRSNYYDHVCIYTRHGTSPLVTLRILYKHTWWQNLHMTAIMASLLAALSVVLFIFAISSNAAPNVTIMQRNQSSDDFISCKYTFHHETQQQCNSTGVYISCIAYIGTRCITHDQHYYFVQIICAFLWTAWRYINLLCASPANMNYLFSFI